MTTTSPSDVDLRSLLDEPHDLVIAALEEPEVGGLSAVTWCSAHLVAADQVLYRAARRVPEGRPRVRVARAADRLLQQALCRLDRRLTGDAHSGAHSVDDLAEQVRKRLQVHADAEGQVLDALVTQFTPYEQRQLADQLAAATVNAPTRPHPHTRHTPLAPLVDRVDAVVDRVRDVMDNRPVPSDRPPRRASAPGRWACYLLGVPFPSTARRGADDAPSGEQPR